MVKYFRLEQFFQKGGPTSGGNMEPSHLVPAPHLLHYQIWMTPFLPRTSALAPFSLPAAVSLSSIAINVSVCLTEYLFASELSLFIILHFVYCSLYYNMKFWYWANTGKYSTYYEHLIFLYIRKLFLFHGNFID